MRLQDQEILSEVSTGKKGQKQNLAKVAKIMMKGRKKESCYIIARFT